MSVESRITQAPACKIIQIEEAEYPHYTGCGVRLARFENDAVVGMFNPADVAWQKDTEAMANEALDNAIAWLSNAEGEVWVGVCSCYQLCEPSRITMTDAAAIARLARMIGDEFRENS